jgi:hypothetical protein
MRLILTVALSTLMLSAPASAQTRIAMEHAETASVLRCLLEHVKACSVEFVARAGLVARPWRLWIPSNDIELGPLLSWEYAGTESANAYTTKFVNGRMADVYDVKFKHQEVTAYIVKPGPDGDVNYMFLRNGAPVTRLQICGPAIPWACFNWSSNRPCHRRTQGKKKGPANRALFK